MVSIIFFKVTDFLRLGALQFVLGKQFSSIIPSLLKIRRKTLFFRVPFNVFFGGGLKKKEISLPEGTTYGNRFPIFFTSTSSTK